jgi:hypothetical protein
MPHVVFQKILAFSRHMDLAEYAKPLSQLELAADFMRARMLVPDMTFDAFLERYKEIAGMEDPKEVIKRVLPKVKKDVEGGFSDTDRQEFVLAYLELVEECDTAKVPVPMTFEQFATLPDLRQAQAAGVFTLPALAKAKRKKEAVVEVVSTLPGTRAVLTEPSGEMQRGVVVEASLAQIVPPLPEHPTPPIVEPVVFQADSGEMFLDTMRAQLTPSEDPPPRPHVNPDGTPMPIVQSRRLNIPKHEAERIIQVERAGLELGVVPPNEAAYTYRCDFGDYVALFMVMNARPIWVDAVLAMTADTTVVLCSLPPRKNLLGSIHAGIPDPLAVSHI